MDECCSRGTAPAVERMTGCRSLIGCRGDRDLHFCNGSDLLGDDDYEECTVDGVHPTDLGFYRMARSLEPVIRRILDR